MIEMLYPASAFALLAFYLEPVSLRPAETKKVFLSLLRGSAVLFLTALFMVIAEGLFEKSFSSGYPREAFVPFLMTASTLAARALKKGNAFFLTLLGFGFFVLDLRPPVSFWAPVSRLAMLWLFFTLIRFALEGLRFRLLFSPVPKRLAGIPALIFSLAVFLAAISALKGIGK